MWPFSSSKESAPAAAPPAAAPAAAGEGDAAQYLRTHSFNTQTPEVPTEAPTAASLLRHTALDPVQLHPLANLSDDLEYLDIQENQASQMEGARTALPSRGWTDDLCYGTGTSYLGGLFLGGVLGLREGLTRPLGIDSPTTRLRVNAVLNQVTRRGTFLGNSAGVIAMTYNLFDAAIDASRGKHDIYGSLAAGALSGALYNSTNGLRAMAVSSTVMMAAAAAWTGFKKTIL
ncbi:Mitochondrial import inner membrane translocase subunit tim23 [Malassezia cuniculi]|uniref:Mitochondrial import inner membrane translocase subunit tim23 n=1 Tax=Malassezia cuniculi TaxID=948313 RepID=A0AAF0ESF4_9BASI|nr:Mitochondrial import inner membrane translocase subunit tim23 [Malassezia cuniculi]